MMKTLILLGTLCWITVTAQQNITNLSQANNEFCFSLLKQFPEDQNVFFSPVSIYIALGMLFAGANSTTAEVMQQVLKYQHENATTNETIHESFSNVINSLNTVSSEYKLSIANAFLYQQGYPIFPEFNDTLLGYYNAFLKGVDFANDTKGAIEEINNWVNNKTNGKIEKLVEELPPDTVMILLNAIYFKGTWKKPFDKRFTRNGTFYNGGVDAVTVPMMNVEGEFLVHFPEKRFKAIELPYKGGNLGMLIILPLENDKLAEVEATLNYDNISSVISEMFPLKMEVTIPKFKIEDSRELKNNLSNLGLENLFSPKADFSNINGQTNLAVSDVLHKATIEVNEEGSEAAASTGVAITEYSAKPMFTANRPFLYLIRDVTTNMILFAGRVNDL
uniref:Putative serpin-like protein ase inhibitor n=1 Tax=Tityus obscurus TaxID=1221240 RepID=A0A1E1WVS4_TITOB